MCPAMKKASESDALDRFLATGLRAFPKCHALSQAVDANPNTQVDDVWDLAKNRSVPFNLECHRSWLERHRGIGDEQIHSPKVFVERVGFNQCHLQETAVSVRSMVVGRRAGI